MSIQLRCRQLLCLAVLIPCGACKPAGVELRNPSADGSTHAKLTAFGDITFAVPAGWTIARTNTKNTQAFVVLIGANPKAPDGMFKVDVVSPANPSLQANAETLAGADGKISSGVSIDGEEAISIETPSTAISRPHVVQMCMHNQRLYMIMGGRAGEIDLKTPFEQIISTWRWTD